MLAFKHSNATIMAAFAKKALTPTRLGDKNLKG
jgi:hypothetical protein